MALASGPKGNFDEALYDAAQSNLRLARIREILSKKNCDAILLVTGVDSHSSVQSTKAINYLLLGHSGHVLRQDSLGDEDLEEVMVLVHKGGVRLYSTPPVARKLNAITAAWANCEVFVLDEKSHRDQDVFEDHKVAAFKEMVQGFETIGIPESGDPRRTIEKWPIIQSYAVDEQGTRKFFTMSHKIIDVTHELSDVYSSLDLHGFSTMMLTSLELFKRHWTTTLVNLDAVYGGTKLSPLLASKSLREIQDFIAEPLTTYFTYGTLRNPDALPQFGLHGPRVWFGAQTADGTGEDAAPLHMTVTMQDPQSPVWCARTYFLTTGHVPNLEPLGPAARALDDSEVAKYAATVAGNVHWLMAHYLMLAEAVALMKEDVQAVLAGGSTAGAYVRKAAAQLGILLPKGFEVDAQVEATTRQLDFSAFHTFDPTPGECSAACVVQLGLKLNGIRNPDNSSRVLGAVTYGDTFLYAGGRALCCVTEGLAPFEVWGGHSTERLARSTAVAALQMVKRCGSTEGAPAEEAEDARPLGRLLADFGEDSGVHFAAPLTGIAKWQSSGNTATAFEHGVLLNHDRLGPFNVLQFEEAVSHVVIHDDKQLNSPIIIAFSLKPDFTPALSIECAKKFPRPEVVVMCFNIHSRAKRALLSDVLPKWRVSWDKHEVPHKDMETIPFGLLSQCHDVLRNVANMARKVARMDMEEDDGEITGSPESLALHDLLEESPAVARALNQLQLSMTTKLHSPQKWDLQPSRPTNDCTNAAIVSLHVLSGIPGGGKHRLAQTVAHYIRTRHSTAAVHTVSFSMAEGICFKADLMLQKLRAALEASPKSGKVHIIVITPGYTAIAYLLFKLQAIVTDLNSEVAGTGRSLKIESSTTVVNTDNFYANHLSKPPFQLLPHVLDQCTSGFATAVLLQSITSGVTTSTVEGHIRQCNPHCSFVYSPLALVGAMGLGTGDEGDDDVPLTECVLHTMQSVRRQALPEPYLHTHDVAPMNSLYLTMPSLPVSQHNVRELTAKISDPKQSKVRILLGKMHVEGYARQVTIYNGKGYRCNVSKPASDPMIRQDQCLFVVGHQLDSAEEALALKEALRSTTSVMKAILNIDGKGEFEPGVKQPLLTRESLIQEDIDHIASLHRETPLPEGCFYDGSQFIDAEGGRCKQRPDLEDLVLEFIEEQNTIIAKQNESKPEE